MKNQCKFYCYRNTRKPNSIINSCKKNIEMVVFDMDGVLTDIQSSWKYIHDFYKTSNDHSVNEYLKGNIDDMEFIRRDADLWKENGKPITKKRLEEILSPVPLMKGADECITYLKKNNIKTAIVSAGLDVLAKRVSKKLGINYTLANGINSDEFGNLNGIGILNVKLMYKDIVVKNLAKKHKIPLENIAAVGNSCFDIPMFEISGLGIAFNPEDDCTRKAADYVIEEKDLRKILPFIKN